MATDFSDTRKLGFLRVIQTCFALNIALTIGMVAFLAKESYQLTFPDALDFMNQVFDAIAFWLIWQHKKATRTFVLCFTLFNIIAGTAFNIGSGTFNPLDQVVLSAIDIFLFIYFLTSRRVKAQLTQPFSAEIKEKTSKENADYYKPRTWVFWRNIIIYFCVFSVVGHWLEAFYCMFIRLGILPGIYDPNSQIWSDWLYPFLVYGIGAAACVIVLYPVKSLLMRKFKGILVPLVISFIVNAAVCTSIELVMGLMMNQPLPDGTMPLWDYRDMFCNFMGQICLQNALAFGFVATLMVWVIYPALEGLFARLSKDVMNVVFVAIVVGFGVLFFLYCINVLIPGVNDGTISLGGDGSAQNQLIEDGLDAGLDALS